MAGLTNFLRKASEKASDVLQKVGIGDAMKFPGKDGDIIYSKNNVCVHPPTTGTTTIHVPGYLSIHCQRHDTLGTTLIMQWLPNSTLETNPNSVATVSPRSSPQPGAKPTRMQNGPSSAAVENNENDVATWDSASRSRASYRDAKESDEVSALLKDNGVPSICPETSDAAALIDDKAKSHSKAASSHVRPSSFTAAQRGAASAASSLGVPAINVIPTTPGADYNSDGEAEPNSDASPLTEEEDSGNEELDELASENNDGNESSPYSSDDDDPGTPTQETAESGICSLLQSFKNFELLEGNPEKFAQSHNMMLPDGAPSDSESAQPNDDITPTPSPQPKQSASTPTKTQISLFSADLGNMRSLRLFYSNADCTCGQLVIASQAAQYKILHFHCGGLDKIANIFEQWNLLHSRSKRGDNSPSLEKNCRQFAVCRPQVTKPEQHPEEGLYDVVTAEFWKFCATTDGSIPDSVTLRKAIFFGGLDPSLRREAWPFLLHVYAWDSTREQRETIRNDLFLEYQNIRKKRLKQALKSEYRWQSVDNTISKDVVRTDRRNPYYEGDDNPNVEIMRNVLLNYAAFCPQVGYIQGMSDLLAPILAALKGESDSFWCFAGLMQRSIFVSAPRENNMDCNLEYLRELLKLMYSDFYKHLLSLGGDALNLLFCHRWILLCFKREFPEDEALRIWQTCWSNYQTEYFHLFIALAIISIYGDDIMAQRLPNDEILLYFSSLAMHMSGEVILKKARGLLYTFQRQAQIPCTLAGICDLRNKSDMWDGNSQLSVVCVRRHDDAEVCPFLALNEPF